MVSRAAALHDARSFGGRSISQGNVRRATGLIARHSIACIAAVAAVGTFGIAATLAASWLANGTLSSGTYIKRTMGPGALALVEPQSQSAAGTNNTFTDTWSRGTGMPPIVWVPERPAVQTAAATPVIVKKEGVPLPRRHPAPLELARVPETDAHAKPQVAQPKPESKTHIAPQVAIAVPPPARPKEPVLSEADRRTALYDIVGKVVYMPNGEKLEAHSGLGEMRDDPRYIKTRMRGPTPPNVYDLTMREALFHGVRAVRLTPVDEGKMHGRDGMLAHTYMLGPNGQSNGCVSFKDYRKFLNAFQNGEVNRLVVVADLGRTPWRMAVAQHSQVRRYAANGRSGERGDGTW